MIMSLQNLFRFSACLTFFAGTLMNCQNSPAENTVRRGPALAESSRVPSNDTSSLADGASIYKKYCVLCHGADGKLGLNGAKNLQASELPLAERINIITNGKGIMTPFGEILTPDEIKSVAQYTLKLQGK